MRILLACEFYYPSVGGVQEVMRQIGERFVLAGHEVSVATTYLAERQAQRINGVQVEEFRVSGNLVRGMTGDLDLYREYVRRQHYDLLVIKAAQQWTFDALTAVLGEIRRAKIFIPCGFSGMFDPSYAGYYSAMPKWLREFDRLIFYASEYRDISMARRNGLTNIEIVPNGADEREFNVSRDSTFRARHGIPEEAFLVTTVGSLTGLKGHVELAGAFDKCNFGDRTAGLLLIGNRPVMPPWREQARHIYQVGGPVRVAKWLLRRWLERVGLPRILTRFGYPSTGATEGAIRSILRRVNAETNKKAWLVDLPRQEVIQAYLNSDLFVFASNIEYSPLVLFEAAAAGLPFLSVPVGNAAEIATWTGGGIICEADVDANGYTHVDPAKLAQRIEWLARQPEVLARLSADGRRSWEERFSWSTIFRTYEKIFEECLEEAAA